MKNIADKKTAGADTQATAIKLFPDPTKIIILWLWNNSNNTWKREARRAVEQPLSFLLNKNHSIGTVCSAKSQGHPRD